MAVVALNWELGADYGHIARFLPIALALRRQGHEPVAILRDVSRAHAFFAPHGIEYLQAPLWTRKVEGLPPELNFTETLFRFGFLEPDGLLALAQAWRALWRRLRPQLMLFDHAPTALLAARGLGIPGIVLGNAFAVPPLRQPLPPYRWWLPHAALAPRLAETDRRLVHCANRALAGLGAPPLQRTCDLYDLPQRFICSHAELDAYGERADAHYIGIIHKADEGETPQWPAGEGPRVFAYLKPGYRHFGTMLDALAASGARVLAFAPGAAPRDLERVRSRITLSPRPLRLAEACDQADAGICHAGGTTDQLLQSGKPVLLLPMQMEQTMTARRAQATGACLHQPMDAGPDALAPLLQRLLHEAPLAQAARGVASAFGPQGAGFDRLVGACADALA